MKKQIPSSYLGEEDAQLGLFDEPPDSTPAPRQELRRELEMLRDRLPDRVRLGTSSWTFPGWAGLVYHRRYPNQRAFLRESLGEYATHPLMRTVGVDRSYYAPVPPDDLTLYANQLPGGFRCAMKIWQRIAMPVYPRHARYGDNAGKANSDFLDAGVFAREVHAPVRDFFDQHMGPWILEIPPTPVPLDQAWFLKRLGAFLRTVPRDFPFAVELRDRRLLTREYARTLRDHDASHVFNYWSRMPRLADQMRVEGLLDASLLVVRLLLPPGSRYADRKEAYAPFDQLVEPQQAMRQDVKRLVLGAIEKDREAYVLVNNKAEGSSPLTVKALAELLAR